MEETTPTWKKTHPVPRRGCELTQEKAAELAEITLRLYQDLEAGKKAPSYLTLRRLAKAYRIKSWDQLIP